MHYRIAPVFVLALVLSACQTAPGTLDEGPEQAESLSPLPELPAGEGRHYRIDPDDSDVRVLVFKAGALARFGHNHVVRADEVNGDVYLTDEPADSGFEITIPLAGFVVDPPQARAVEGEDFESELSDEARQATRENMLGSDGLDADRHPEIRIRSAGLVGPPWQMDATIRITLNGVTRERTVPIAVVRDDQTLTVIGRFDLNQTDYGLKPFTAMGGGLKVADELRVRFRLVARRG